YTIGFGTTRPSSMVCSPSQLGSDPFGGGPVGRPPSGDARIGQFQRMDEKSLQTIADMTGGEYFAAENAERLLGVFRSLPAEITRQDEEVEISVVFAALGAVFAVAAVGLSMRWNRYP